MLTGENEFKNLIRSIILRAVEDYELYSLRTNDDKNNIKMNAKQYLKSEECRYMCDVVGIDYFSILKKTKLES